MLLRAVGGTCERLCIGECSLFINGGGVSGQKVRGRKISTDFRGHKKSPYFERFPNFRDFLEGKVLKCPKTCKNLMKKLKIYYGGWQNSLEVPRISLRSVKMCFQTQNMVFV